ncbi:hypothetical protein [Actinoplanes sp. NPDC051851]
MPFNNILPIKQADRNQDPAPKQRQRKNTKKKALQTPDQQWR